MLNVKNLSFNYGDNRILGDLNLGFNKGEFVSIIGANGSGKTTLINCISRMNDAYIGNVSYKDREIQSYAPNEIAREFSVIFQMKKIKFPFTCFEAVMMGRHPYKSRLDNISEEDIRIVSDVMEKTDTFKFADSLLTEISGGEFQRVVFARALVQEPKILFLDEAFSNMDISYKVKFLRLLKDMVEKRQLLVIAVMHDINLAYGFSDRICMLKDGGILDFGRPEEVMNEASISSVFNIEVEKIDNRGFYIKTE